MNTSEIIKMAIEAHLFDDDQDPLIGHLKHFAELVTQKERESRQAAQAESAQLKARLARSGVELRKAVRDERDECAKVCDMYATHSSNPMNFAENCAQTIRNRKRFSDPRNHVVDANKMDCTDCDCADNEPCKRTAPALALESGEFVPAEKISGWAAA